MKIIFSFLQSNDKQSFLDSGILCCLIYILNAFLNCNNSDKGRSPNSANLRENISSEKDKNTIKVKCLEVCKLFLGSGYT